MKFKAFSLATLGSILISIGCSNRKGDEMSDGIEVDRSAYLSKIGVPADHSTTDGHQLKLIALNNPYKLGEDVILTYFLNGEVIYSGQFLTELEVSIPRLADESLVHMKLEVLDGSEVFVFEDKSVFHWMKDYQFVYYGFFPGNKIADQIHFLPQHHSVIQ